MVTSPDNTPLNPVQIEKEMVDSLNSISQSIKPVSDAYNTWKSCELAYKREFAMAYRDAHGSIKDREQEAVLETEAAADELKDAEVKYKYTLDHQRAYRDRLSAFQTLAKSVNAAYGAAGVANG